VNAGRSPRSCRPGSSVRSSCSATVRRPRRPACRAQEGARRRCCITSNLPRTSWRSRSSRATARTGAVSARCRSSASSPTGCSPKPSRSPSRGTQR
jgi:hypothetical protein